MSRMNTRALLKRIAWALFFALVACGITFYVVIFLGLMVNVFTRGVNPVNAPTLNDALRRFALPASLAIAVAMFALAMTRKGHEKAATDASSTGHSKVDGRTGRVLIK